MQSSKAPEFSLHRPLASALPAARGGRLARPLPAPKRPEFRRRRPLASALATIRAVLFSPRTFFSNFQADGPLKEPILFALLVGTVTGVLAAVVALVSTVLPG